MEVELGNNVANVKPLPLPADRAEEVTSKMEVFGKSECLHNPGMAWLSTTSPHHPLGSWYSFCIPFGWVVIQSIIPAAIVALVYGLIPVGPVSPPHIVGKLVYLLVFTP